MSYRSTSYISAIVIEQQARDLRAQVVRQAAVRASNAVKAILESVRESVAQARATRGGALFGTE
jgi:hypothetical protein